MKRMLCLFACLLLAACSKFGTPPSPSAADIPAGVSLLDQGWSAADREIFYTTGQGSHLMPYRWFAALRTADGSMRFAENQLARYGYLPSAGPAGLPVGFVVDASSGDLGMTCAACHTGQLSYRGTILRVDGGRANANFGLFLADLTAAARATLASQDRLDAFAKEAAGATATPAEVAGVKQSFAAWVSSFGGFMDNSLRGVAWGPGRLDAFGMIFNRVTGLDLGIAANERPADAPVRYPFLWNAAFQDRTQWDGAAPNGNHVNGMARNTGEVFGVFGQFTPQLIGPHLAVYTNSALFRNLQTLEEEIARLKPPAWPKKTWPVDQAIADAGAKIFDANCASCHAPRPSKSVQGAWATPVCRVGTDPKMYDNALLSGRSGVLAGTLQLSTGGRLQDPDKKVAILANAVTGSLLLDAAGVDSGIWRAINTDLGDRLDPKRFGAASPVQRADLPPECSDAAASGIAPTVTAPAATVIQQATKDLYKMPPHAAVANAAGLPSDAAYEARVLNGVWAVAPYLHNGSVPSLSELLKPAAARVRAFPVGGGEFDPAAVGLSLANKTGNQFIVDDSNGNSNAGHEYGTTLSDDDRKALLEYLKTL